MRLDPLLDSFYLVGSLWGATGSRVCPSTPASPGAALEVTWSPGSRAPAGVMAFVDVSVVPMDTERVLEHQTVLVEGGTITALGPASKVKVPAGAVRVDGRGKYLMPGLADMHFGPGHWIVPPPAGQERAFADQLFSRYLAHGVTALRSVTGSGSAPVQQLRRIAAEFPVPRMYLGLERIPRLPLSQPDSVAAHIAAIKAAGYDHIDADDNFTANGLGADSLTLAALRRGGLPLTTHRHGIPFAHALKLGIAGGSVEHLYVFWDSLLGMPGPAGIDPKEQRQPVELPMAKVPALVAAIKRAGIWITPSLECMEVAHPHIKGRALTRIVKALHDADVKMLLGGDGWALSRWSVHGELAALVRAGLTPYQALLTGTRNVAEFLHLLDSAGTVAVGKRADLLLLSGNPLRDVKTTWEPAGVMVAGRWFDRAALDQRQLASPRVWFEELLSRHIPESQWMSKQLMRDMASASFSTPRSVEQWDELERRGKRVFVLADSLDRTNRQVYGRMVPLIAAELGPIRAILTPEQREAFDINLRVWLREQARQGYTVTVPGVAPVP